ncbi:UNVERIFIED_CONTAM: Zinc finger CCCH domain-containing protein 22 [Sesamum radiatum]|uniref:Zinc finger CCCH domain-containing protein 22 n=1 Tax=Sesamum radiatum TaxID=300843 RepID=A0AAW2UQA1_SESRA
MYFARGFCKNGSTCKFLHSDVDPIDVGSPNKTGSGFDELLRMKALQNQRFAFMASGGHHPFAYNKCMDILNENPRCDLSPMGFGAGASSSSRQIYLTFPADSTFKEEDVSNYFRSDFSSMGFMGGLNSSSRQIYLTFPADSTFKEEDVSNYFSMFGPVQDVRIPYQQKRMFGFVTFVYAETVKLILAKGNPHFVCDSRVLVKPYKEKGKIPDKKQQQQQQHLERGEFSACLSPSGIDSRDHNIDLPFGSRMLFSTQEMMLRRKLEQEAELQHAIELQDFDGNQETAKSQVAAADRKLVPEGTDSSTDSAVGGNKQQNVLCDDSDLPESLEHILPDNLFASPTKSAAEHHTIFSQTSASADDSTPVTIKSSNTPGPPGSSPLGMASLKSCYIQMPRYYNAAFTCYALLVTPQEQYILTSRFSSGQEAIEM